MVKLRFYGGVGEIGGNKVLLEDEDTRIFLDFGMSFGRRGTYYGDFLGPRTANGLSNFLEMGLVPDLKGLYRADLLATVGRKAEPPEIDAVLLSHAHLDHSRYISFLHEKIPVYCGETCHLILLPTTGLPDYVALTPREKPVLIEVKNTSSENRSEDKFQAAFYNTLGKTVGVVVQHIRFTGENAQPEPKLVLEQDAETLIVYPRLAKWTRVDDTVDMDDDDIRDVWRAKELGVLGKSLRPIANGTVPIQGLSRNCPRLNWTRLGSRFR